MNPWIHESLFILNTFGLIETEGLFKRGRGGGGRVLFNLVKAMVLVLHRNPKCKVEKLKYKTLEGMHPEIKNKSELPAGNKPSWISPDEVLQSRLINTVYHNKGGGGLKREGGGGGLSTFFPWKMGGSLLERGGLFERGGGGLIEDLRYVCCSFLPLLTPGTLRKIQLRGFSIQFQILKE